MDDAIYDARELAALTAYSAFVSTIWLRRELGGVVDDRHYEVAIELLRNSHASTPYGMQQRDRLLAMLGAGPKPHQH